MQSTATNAPSPRLSNGWPFVWRLITRFPWAYIASSVGIWTFYLFPLVAGALHRQVFEQLGTPVQSQAQRNAVIAMLLLTALAVVLRSAFVSGWLGERMVNALCPMLIRHNLLLRILQRPGASPLPPGSSSGEAISRLRDDLLHIGEFVAWTADPIGQALTFGVALVVLLRIDIGITLIAFGPLLGLLLLTQLLNRRVRALREANQKAIGGVTGLLGEIFGAAQAIKVVNAEQRIVEHLQRANAKRRKAALRDHLIFSIVEAFSFGAGHIATGLVMIVGAAALRSGDISVGELVVFSTYLGWLATVGGMLGGFVTRYQQMLVSLNRGAELLQGSTPLHMVTAAPELRILGARALTSAAVATPERTDALRSVEAQALCYTFPNSAVGLRDVSLQIARGQLVIVTGRIGSGKTTLLRVLLGLLPAQSGQLLWNGRRIDQPDVFLTPPRVAYTPQTPRLFSDTLRDNLLLGAHVSNSELDRAIYQAVLERDIPVLEHGLETRVGPRGVKLSGGQLQRSAAARMFVRHADLMVFDDLSSALDVRTEQTLWQRLRQRQDLTCLAVSTRQVAFEQADWIYVMRDGAVLAEGTREQLLATSDEFRSLYSETGGDANAEL